MPSLGSFFLVSHSLLFPRACPAANTWLPPAFSTYTIVRRCIFGVAGMIDWSVAVSPRCFGPMDEGTLTDFDHFELVSDWPE